MEMLTKEFGSSIIPLTFHVDYWDRLGWKDPFSDRRWTDRQTDYSRSFGQDSIYTPEMVVQGETGFVGSDMSHARREIQSRLGATRRVIALKTTPSPDGSVLVEAQLPLALANETKNILLVIFENAPPVQVLRGENKGATMSGRFAVRHQRAMPAPVGGFTTARLRAETDWKSERLGIVILAQAAGQAILAAQSASWPGN